MDEEVYCHIAPSFPNLLPHLSLPDIFCHLSGLDVGDYVLTGNHVRFKAARTSRGWRAEPWCAHDPDNIRYASDESSVDSD